MPIVDENRIIEHVKLVFSYWSVVDRKYSQDLAITLNPICYETKSVLLPNVTVFFEMSQMSQMSSLKGGYALSAVIVSGD